MKIIPSKNKTKKWTAFFDLGEKDKKGKPKEKAVSYWILWSSPSFGGSIRNFKRKFNL